MPLMLVDDRDGRVVSEIETYEQMAEVLEAAASGDLPEFLCLVELKDWRGGSLVGTRSSVAFRLLPDR